MCVNFLNAGVWGLLRSVADLGFEKEGGGGFNPTGGGVVLYNTPDCSYFPHEIEMVQNRGWGGGGGGVLAASNPS